MWDRIRRMKEMFISHILAFGAIVLLCVTTIGQVFTKGRAIWFVIAGFALIVLILYHFYQYVKVKEELEKTRKDWGEPGYHKHTEHVYEA